MSTTVTFNHLLVLIVVLSCVNLALRALVVALSPPPRRRRRHALKTLVVLGSGGHTAEMFAIMRALDARRYSPRAYVLAATDTTSAVKVERFERALRQDLASAHVGASEGELGSWSRHTVTVIPRSREVGQSYVHSVFTTLYALVFGRAGW